MDPTTFVLALKLIKYTVMGTMLVASGGLTIAQVILIALSTPPPVPNILMAIQLHVPIQVEGGKVKPATVVGIK